MKSSSPDRGSYAPFALRLFPQGKEIRVISAEALDLLAAYPWPGNVRELENVIERAVVLVTRDRITVAALPSALRAGEVPPGLGEARTSKSACRPCGGS